METRFPLTNVLALSIGVTLTVPSTFDITLEEFKKSYVIKCLTDKN